MEKAARQSLPAPGRKISRAVLPAYRKIKLAKMCTEENKTETFLNERGKGLQSGNRYIK